MTKRTFVTKSGDTWEWEETPEFVKAIEIYYHIVENNKKADSKPKFAGNYPGPLYSPHPDLKRPNEYKATDD